jgi:C1A family cysteine protease
MMLQKLLTAGLLLLAIDASAVEFQSVKSKLDQKKSSWLAQESPFKDSERKTLIRAGAADEEEPGFNALTKELENWNETATSLPVFFDWRDRDGRNFLPDPSHQGECGSCVSFASIAALEAQLNIACDSPERSFNMSRQFFFSCGGGFCRNGWKLSSAMSFLTESGVPDASCMPYTSSEGRDTQCSAACTDFKDRSINGIATKLITSGYIDRDKIKAAILNGPLVANMILYEDLEYYKDGVYRHIDGAKLGNHAIVFVGWDNSDSSWIAMNSWGPEWGQRGFFKVAWDDVSLPGRYTWSIDVQRPLQTGICNYPR